MQRRRPFPDMCAQSFVEFIDLEYGSMTANISSCFSHAYVIHQIDKTLRKHFLDSLELI